jgi:hypothetical protein
MGTFIHLSTMNKQPQLHKLGFHKQAWLSEVKAIMSTAFGAAKGVSGIAPKIRAVSGSLARYADPAISAFKPVENVTSDMLKRPAAGIFKGSPLGQIDKVKQPTGMGVVGNQANIVSKLFDPAGGNIFKRVGGVLGDEVTRSKFHFKDVGNKTMMYNRSALGRVAAPLATTGVGIGAISTAMPDSGDNSPMGRAKSGIKNTLGWGLAGPVYGPYVLGRLGFDIAKGNLNK